MPSSRALIIAIVLLALVALMLVLARPALAGGDWKLESVECQVDTKSIIVSGLVKGGGDTVDDVYYDYRLIYLKHVNLTEAGEGHFTYIMTRPIVQLGGRVTIVNRETGQTVETICHNAVPINAGHGDHWAVLYHDANENDKPSVKIYCVIEGQGQYRGEFDKADFQQYPNKPETNIMVKYIEGCLVPVSVWQLTTGERQVNIGPDVDGKTAVTIFENFPPANVHFYDVDPGLPDWY